MPNEPLIGISLVPEAAAWPRLRELAQTADAAGLDLIGIQDHPYQWRYVDTMALIPTLLASTERIRVFPDVANLPLRLPSVLAKTASSLDLMSGGRFELGLGAGAFWDAIAAMGGPRRSAGESVDALAEAIEVIRLMWSGERSVSYTGRYYTVRGVHPGDPPPHPIEIWVGAYKPRMLALVGRLADGWMPSFGRSSPDELRRSQARIDEAAHAAGRDPADIRRLLNIGGAITERGPGDTRAPAASAMSSLAGPPEYWHDLLDELRGIGFSGFVFWPAEATPQAIEQVAYELAPHVRGLS